MKEGCDLPSFDLDVVEGEGDLAMDRRPVVGLLGNDHDVAVQAHLLAIVLPQVGVVPVHARVRERDAHGEAAAHRDRRLGLVGTVVAVFQAQTVPVHRRLQVTVVDDVHLDLGPLRDA